MNALEITQNLVRTSLQLDAATPLDPDTPLLGGFPDFNSLAIATMIESLEEQLDCVVDDDELTAELFESISTFSAFVESKL